MAAFEVITIAATSPRTKDRDFTQRRQKCARGSVTKRVPEDHNHEDFTGH
jgi:hypothetical protein